MADEYLAAIVELWTSDSPEFEGKYVSFKDVTFEPKPIQNRICRSGSAVTPSRCSNVRRGTRPAGSRG